MTARTRIVDNRGIPGLTPSSVEMPTVEIPVNCMCSWSVVKAGIGRACISRARFFNSLCPRIRDTRRWLRLPGSWPYGTRVSAA